MLNIYNTPHLQTLNEHMLQIKVNTETTHLSDAKVSSNADIILPQLAHPYGAQEKSIQRTPSDSDTDVVPYPYDQKGGNFIEA